jgi:purine-binding chemotaxis protein CheW
MRMEHQRPADQVELLVFELAGMRYVLELGSVREVLPAVLIAPLPQAPPVIEGIIDLRGELVPVYDVRVRFGLPARALNRDERLVIAWTGSRVVAFRCERAEWVEQVPRSLIEAPDAVRGAGRHIAGVARMPDGLVLIQNLDAFLDEAETVELDAALSARSDRAAL